MSEGRHFQSPRENVEKKALQKGAKAAANAIGGPLAGKAVDLVSKSKLGNAALNGGIQRVHRLNPGMVRPQTLNNSTNNSDETEDRINPSTDGSAAIDLPKLNPLGRTGGMFSLDSNARKDAKKSLWKRIPLALRLKIIAGVAAIILIFLIIMLIISMANPFNFLDMSGDSVANSTGGDFYNELNNYWSTLCEEGDKNCDADEIEKAKKIRESQQDFLKRFDEVTTGLNEEQRRALMTTIFMGYSVDSFYTNGESGAFVVDRSCDDPENCAEETQDDTKIYREANDTLKKLVKEFGSPVKTDTFYEYLKTSDFLDKREVLNEYYEKYASKNGLDASRKTSWNDSDKQAVREEIIKKIKDTVAAYMGPSKKSVAYITPSNNNKYWWPIGSDETRSVNGVTFATGTPSPTVITQYYISASEHGAYDIAMDTRPLIIAAKSGVVVDMNTGCTSTMATDCGAVCQCGGTYGNYVTIQHADGLYTHYAHMEAGSNDYLSIGDTVSQGQVIGRMGSSGNSSGYHLHFEIRTTDYYLSRIDPVDYISMDDPRPSSIGGVSEDLVAMLKRSEAALDENEDRYYVDDTRPPSGKYKILCIGDGVTTGPFGVTLNYYSDIYAKYGYNFSEPYSQYCPTDNNAYYINYEDADGIFRDTIKERADYVSRELGNAEVTLSQAQFDAVVHLAFNVGYMMDDFIESYQTYGSTMSLCNNWWHNYMGLSDRRVRECNLFVNGVYYTG